MALILELNVKPLSRSFVCAHVQRLEINMFLFSMDHSTMQYMYSM
jgi:hypothetical protein